MTRTNTSAATARRSAQRETAAPGNLAALFAPSVVAVYGASSEPGSMGNRALKHLVSGGFGGEIVPINPKYGELEGRRCYASAEQYGGHIDHAMVVVRAARTPDVMDDCARAGISSAAILSGGFAEAGSDGVRLQRRVGSIVRASGMRLLGPNCLGFANANAATCASPGSIFENFRVQPGPIAIVSQSGAIAGDILARSATVGVPVAFWVSTGNELNISIADCISFLATDDDISVVAIYMEGVKDPHQLRTALDIARRSGKKLVLLRSGRTQAGVSAVQSHTGSLVSDERLYQATFREYSVSVVSSVREMVDTLRAAHVVGIQPRKVAIVTSSGGSGALAADAAVSSGVNMARISKAAQQRLHDIVPFCSPTNPIDITGMTNENPDVLVPFLSTVLEEPDVDLAVFVHGTGMLWLERGEWISRILVDIAKRFGPDRLVFVGALPEPVIGTLQEAGIAIFDDIVDLVHCLGLLWATTDKKHRSRVGQASRPRAEDPGVQPVSEDEALELLDNKFNVPVVRRIFVDSRHQLSPATKDIGFPLAAKLVLPGVTHKTELGAVRLGIRTLSDLEDLWDQFAQIAKSFAAPVRVLLEEMVEDATAELLISAFVDPVMGPFVVVGAGGVLTEVADDLAIAPAPVSIRRAQQLLETLRVGGLAAKSRQGVQGDVGSAAEVVVKVSRAIGHPLPAQRSTPARNDSGHVREIEINPFLVRPAGSCAVDAVIAMERPNRPSGGTDEAVGPTLASLSGE